MACVKGEIAVSEDQQPPQERRGNARLREIFEDAYALVSPFLDTSGSWGNKPMMHSAQGALHENYADLSPQQATILLTALCRVYTERHQ